MAALESWGREPFGSFAVACATNALARPPISPRRSRSAGMCREKPFKRK